MTDTTINFGYSDGDVDTNRSANISLNEIVAERYSRRQTLFGGIGAATMALFGTSMLTACGDDDKNAAPVVSAGAAAATTSGRMVTLTGTATDDGNVNAFWVQTGGPAVALNDGGKNIVTFLAPSVSAATEFKFQFTGSDDRGKSAVAETIVTVSPAVLGFTAVAKSQADVVSVPAGYTATVVYRTGDPIAAGVSAYANDGSDSGFAQRAGDHHDGMYYFGLSAAGTPDLTSSTRAVMCINHENINQAYLHPNGATSGTRPYDEVLKEVECHGISVVEFAQGTGGAWGYVQNSAYNRRITPLTPTTFSGPAKGAAFLKTAYSTDGTKGRGTINNCANGYTPWATYLTCEENWVGYFRRDASDVTARAGTKDAVSLSRYGKGSANGGSFNWTTATAPAGDTSIAKFNITLDSTKPADGTGDFRNEIYQYGWVVEIDPYDKTQAPRKRTALGRMNHEGAWPGKLIDGRKPAWYMGDDAVNEYLYKFVSNTAWAAADASSTNRLAIGDKYLDAGTLYVAKFNADGSGQWLPLVFGTGPLTAANTTYAFADQADVLANARLAADALGATKMDRPEWTAVNPVTGEMYLTLTNNSTRNITTNPTDAANPRAYTDPKVTSGATNGNANGHIIRLKETGDTTEATGFTWDIYLFGSGKDLDAANINLSGLDDTNDLSSPDGLWFGRPQNASGLVKPLLWIETDDGAYTDVTNCMLLCGQPGTVGDGTTKTITNSLGGSTATQATRIGAAPGANLRRFLVGPKECEITGIDSTPDGRTVFVNIQHPGENGNPSNITSNWPASQAGAAPTSRPRSATIAITKNDGGVVGL
ncbi:MAG TPA: alkaline phosphatase PhoX [Novosphingobium sp.]